jgi:hypothetical protein
MTVVVETLGARTYVGRYDREDEGAVHLLDVGVHDEGSAMAKEKYIERSSKFGVRSEHRYLKVPTNQVVRITQLAHWGRGLPDR